MPVELILGTVACARTGCRRHCRGECGDCAQSLLHGPARTKEVAPCSSVRVPLPWGRGRGRAWRRRPGPEQNPAVARGRPVTASSVPCTALHLAWGAGVVPAPHCFGLG